MVYVFLFAVAVAVLIVIGRKSARSGGDLRTATAVLAAIALVGGVAAGVRGSWGIGLFLILLGAGLSGAARRGVVPSWRRPAMTVDEAREILGVEEGAGADEIRAAWRRLMSSVHPDKGGTKGLAERLNAARDVLLKSRSD